MILAALERGRRRPESRYAQLATVRSDGRPANRTVVVRGFLGESNHLSIVTDSRSKKYGEIAANPNVELCWYFAESREQFRLAGLALGDAVDSGARRSAWNGLSEGGRRSFFWPECGAPRAADPEFRAPAELSTPPANFVSLALKISAVDYLDLRPDPHARVSFALNSDGLWDAAALNP